jgi:hypothetical protein
MYSGLDLAIIVPMQPKYILASALVITTAFAGYLIFSKHDASYVPQNDGDRAIAEAAAKLNANLPSAVDEETLLIKALPGPNSITFQHVLVNTKKADIDPAAARLILEPLVRGGACASEELKVYRDLGAMLTYAYYDADGLFVMKIDVDSTTCP